MSNFSTLVSCLLKEYANLASTAYGAEASGEYGNQFPSDNDRAYAHRDARWVFGAKNFKITGKGKGKEKKMVKPRIHRRTPSSAL